MLCALVAILSCKTFKATYEMLRWLNDEIEVQTRNSKTSQRSPLGSKSLLNVREFSARRADLDKMPSVN